MALSILHRVTGVGLGVGTLLLTWWLVAMASGPGAYATFQSFIGSWFGQLLLLGFTASLFFHLCNGIRHLFWDVGKGFELRTANATAWLVLFAAGALTVISWIIGYMVRGGAL